MFGCLRRLGCLALLLVGALLYVTRDRWLPAARAVAGLEREEPATAAADGSWQPLTAEGARRARTRVQSLSARSGPVYANVSAADLAAYISDELRAQLPPSADSMQAAVVGDQLKLRTVVDLSELGGAETLGPLAQFLNRRDSLQFGGTLEIVRPGLAQFRVREIRLGQLAVPARLIPDILKRLNRGAPPPAGVARDALPLAVPAYVGDVRVGRGAVTLYKSVR